MIPSKWFFWSATSRWMQSLGSRYSCRLSLVAQLGFPDVSFLFWDRTQRIRWEQKYLMLLLCGLAHGSYYHSSSTTNPAALNRLKESWLIFWMCQVSPVASAVVNKWSFKVPTAVLEGRTLSLSLECHPGGGIKRVWCVGQEHQCHMACNPRIFQVSSGWWNLVLMFSQRHFGKVIVELWDTTGNVIKKTQDNNLK